MSHPGTWCSCDVPTVNMRDSPHVHDVHQGQGLEHRVHAVHFLSDNKRSPTTYKAAGPFLCLGLCMLMGFIWSC